VTATSVTDPSKSASASISVAVPQVILNDGTYVFHAGGYDPTGPYFLAGAFTVKDSVISAGEQDFMDAGGSYTDSLVASGSSISSANGNIQIVLNTGDPNVGVNGVETLRGTVVADSKALLSQFDASATATGSLDLQTSAVAPAGGYAFNLLGLDGDPTQAQALAVGGILNISGTSLSVTNSVLDYNDFGNVAQSQTFSSGQITAPDSFGRIMLSLTPSSGLPQFALAGYVVGPGEIQLVENQNDALGGDLGGVALGQGAKTGQFNQATVSGFSYAYGANGIDSASFAQLGGAFALNADSTVSGVLVFNDLGGSSNGPITGGNYTIDPTGRVTLNNVTAAFTNDPLTFQLYLDGNGNALELGVDGIQVTAGRAYVQSAPSADFEGNFAISGFGFGNINAVPAWGAVGPVTIAGDSFAGFTDYSVESSDNTSSIATAGVPLTGTEDSSKGVLNLTGLNAGSPQVSNGYGYYPIDDRRVLAIEVDGQQLGLILLEEVQQK
jgi:hypothetical protein